MSSSTAGGIPRIIHHVWIGPGPPVELERCRATWGPVNHPEWTGYLWTDSQLQWLEHRDLFDAAGDIVPADAVGQFRADLARLEILHKHGGLYVDYDTEALAGIDPELGDADLWAAWEEDGRWVGNTYMAAAPGHPALVEALAGIRDQVQRHRGARPNVLTGPKYLTPIWRAHGAALSPSARFFPYSYRHVKRGTIPTEFGADVVAVHHWQHTRDLVGR